MRLIAWLLAIGFGLAGLALRVQGGIPFAFETGTGLIALAGFSCPALWERDGGPFGRLGVRGRDRAMLSLALVVATPLMLPWAF